MEIREKVAYSILINGRKDFNVWCSEEETGVKFGFQTLRHRLDYFDKQV